MLMPEDEASCTIAACLEPCTANFAPQPATDNHVQLKGCFPNGRSCDIVLVADQYGSSILPFNEHPFNGQALAAPPASPCLPRGRTPRLRRIRGSRAESGRRCFGPLYSCSTAPERRRSALLSRPRFHAIHLKIQGPHLGDLPQDFPLRLHSFLSGTLGMAPLHIAVGQGCVHLLVMLLELGVGAGMVGPGARRLRRCLAAGAGADTLPARLMAFMRGVLPEGAAPDHVAVRHNERHYELVVGDAAAAGQPGDLPAWAVDHDHDPGSSASTAPTQPAYGRRPPTYRVVDPAAAAAATALGAAVTAATAGAGPRAAGTSAAPPGMVPFNTRAAPEALEGESMLPTGATPFSGSTGGAAGQCLFLRSPTKYEAATPEVLVAGDTAASMLGAPGSSGMRAAAAPSVLLRDRTSYDRLGATWGSSGVTPAAVLQSSPPVPERVAAAVSSGGGRGVADVRCVTATMAEGPGVVAGLGSPSQPPGRGGAAVTADNVQYWDVGVTPRPGGSAGRAGRMLCLPIHERHLAPPTSPSSPVEDLPPSLLLLQQHRQHRQLVGFQAQPFQQHHGRALAGLPHTDAVSHGGDKALEGDRGGGSGSTSIPPSRLGHGPVQPDAPTRRALLQHRGQAEQQAQELTGSGPLSLLSKCGRTLPPHAQLPLPSVPLEHGMGPALMQAARGLICVGPRGLDSDGGALQGIVDVQHDSMFLDALPAQAPLQQQPHLQHQPCRYPPAHRPPYAAWVVPVTTSTLANSNRNAVSAGAAGELAPSAAVPTRVRSAGAAADPYPPAMDLMARRLQPVMAAARRGFPLNYNPGEGEGRRGPGEGGGASCEEAVEDQAAGASAESLRRSIGRVLGPTVVDEEAAGAWDEHPPRSSDANPGGGGVGRPFGPARSAMPCGVVPFDRSQARRVQHGAGPGPGHGPYECAVHAPACTVGAVAAGTTAALQPAPDTGGSTYPVAGACSSLTFSNATHGPTFAERLAASGSSPDGSWAPRYIPAPLRPPPPPPSTMLAPQLPANSNPRTGFGAGATGALGSNNTAHNTAPQNPNSGFSARSFLGVGLDALEGLGRTWVPPLPLALARLQSHALALPVEMQGPAVAIWPPPPGASSSSSSSSSSLQLPAGPVPPGGGGGGGAAAAGGAPAAPPSTLSVQLKMRCPDVIARASAARGRGRGGRRRLEPPHGSQSTGARTAATGRLQGQEAVVGVPPRTTRTSSGSLVLDDSNEQTALEGTSDGSDAGDGDGRGVGSRGVVVVGGGPDQVSQLVAWTRGGLVPLMQLDDSAEGCTRATLQLPAPYDGPLQQPLPPPAALLLRQPRQLPPPLLPSRLSLTSTGTGTSRGSVEGAGSVSHGSAGTAGSGALSVAAGPNGVPEAVLNTASEAVAPAAVSTPGAAAGAPASQLLYLAWRRGQSLGPPCPVLLLPAGLEDVVEELQAMQPPVLEPGGEQSTGAQPSRLLAAYQAFIADLGIWLEALRLATTTTTTTSSRQRSIPSLHSNSCPRSANRSVPGGPVFQAAGTGGCHDAARGLGSADGAVLRALALTAGAAYPSAQPATMAPGAGSPFVTQSALLDAAPQPLQAAQAVCPAGAAAASTSAVTATATRPPSAGSNGAFCRGSHSTSGTDSDERLVRLAEEILSVGCDLLSHAVASGAVATARLVLGLLLTHGSKVPHVVALVGAASSSSSAAAAAAAGTAIATALPTAATATAAIARCTLRTTAGGGGGGGVAEASGPAVVMTAAAPVGVAPSESYSTGGGGGSAATLPCNGMAVASSRLLGPPGRSGGGVAIAAAAPPPPASSDAQTRGALLRWLMEACRSCSEGGHTLLHLAVMSRSLPMLRLVTEAWPRELGLQLSDLNKVDRSGRAPAAYLQARSVGGDVGGEGGHQLHSSAAAYGNAAAAAEFASAAEQVLSSLGPPALDDPGPAPALFQPVSGMTYRTALQAVLEGGDEAPSLGVAQLQLPYRHAVLGVGVGSGGTYDEPAIRQNSENRRRYSRRSFWFGTSSSTSSNGGGNASGSGVRHTHSGYAVGEYGTGGSSGRGAAAWSGVLQRRRGAVSPSCPVGLQLRGWRSTGNLSTEADRSAAETEDHGPPSQAVVASEHMPHSLQRMLSAVVLVLLGSVQGLVEVLLAMPRARSLPPSASFLAPPGLLLWLPSLSLIMVGGLAAAAGLLMPPYWKATAPWLPAAITAAGRSLVTVMSLAAAGQLAAGRGQCPGEVGAEGMQGPERMGASVGLLTGIAGGLWLTGPEAVVRAAVMALAPVVVEAIKPVARASLLLIEYGIPLLFVVMYDNSRAVTTWLSYAACCIFSCLALTAILDRNRLGRGGA